MRSSPKPVKRALACRDPRIDRDGYASETSTRGIGCANARRAGLDPASALGVNADGTHEDRDHISHDEAAWDREHPRCDDAAGDSPAHRRQAARGTDTEDRTGDRVCRGDRDAETR